MPQRTNEFQKLVYLVRKHSTAGSTVTESKLLRDSNGYQREVDICIEDSIDGIPVTISIECCDLARPATVEWVERMKGKAQTVTDTKIGVAASGNLPARQVDLLREGSNRVASKESRIER
jgi:hypothetical protein